jgi:hypothetical protein
LHAQLSQDVSCWDIGCALQLLGGGGRNGIGNELAASLGVDRGDLLLTAFECGKVALA